MRQSILGITSTWFISGAITLAVLGCGMQPQQAKEEGTDSSTHFWGQCDSASQCGDLDCICGRCTLPCEETSECSGTGSGCYSAADTCKTPKLCAPSVAALDADLNNTAPDETRSGDEIGSLPNEGDAGPDLNGTSQTDDNQTGPDQTGPDQTTTSPTGALVEPSGSSSGTGPDATSEPPGPAPSSSGEWIYPDLGAGGMANAPVPSDFIPGSSSSAPPVSPAPSDPGVMPSTSGSYNGTGEVPDLSVPLPPGCTVDTRPGNDTWCQLDATCDDTLSGVSCSQSGDHWDCWCREPTAGEYRVFADSSSLACPTALGLCSGATVIEDTLNCSLESGNGTPDGCTYREACVNPGVAWNGEAVGILDSFREARCTNLDDSTWSCECAVGDTLVGIESAHQGGDDIAPCQQSLAACTTETLEITGAIECGPSQGTAELESCGIARQCSQAGTLGETPVAARGNVQVGCESDGDESWACQCSVGKLQQDYTVEGADAWAACSEANTRCATEVGIIDVGVMPTPGSSSGFALTFAPDSIDAQGNLPPATSSSGNGAGGAPSFL